MPHDEHAVLAQGAPAMTKFDELAQQQIVKPRARRLQQCAERADKQLREKHEMHAAWRNHRREQFEQLRIAYGHCVDDLVEVLRSAKLEDAAAIITHVEHAHWLRHADADDRYAALSLIGDAIAKLRESHKLPSFDDALWGEPPTVFEIIREILR
jgi:hypothetical protein